MVGVDARAHLHRDRHCSAGAAARDARRRARSRGTARASRAARCHRPCASPSAPGSRSSGRRGRRGPPRRAGAPPRRPSSGRRRTAGRCAATRPDRSRSSHRLVVALDEGARRDHLRDVDPGGARRSPPRAARGRADGTPVRDPRHRAPSTTGTPPRASKLEEPGWVTRPFPPRRRSPLPAAGLADGTVALRMQEDRKGKEPLELDHVVLGVIGLDEIAARELLEDHGLIALPGGHHPLWGTANRIVPLGGCLPRARGRRRPRRRRDDPFGRWVADMASRALRLGLGGTHPRRRSDRGAPRARHRPWIARHTHRAELRWQLARLPVEGSDRSQPFFIEWGEGSPLPGTAFADHPAHGAHVRARRRGDRRRCTRPPARPRRPPGRRACRPPGCDRRRGRHRGRVDPARALPCDDAPARSDAVDRHREPSGAQPLREPYADP